MLVLIQIVICSLEVYRKLFTVAPEQQIVKNCAALAKALLPPRGFLLVWFNHVVLRDFGNVVRLKGSNAGCDAQRMRLLL